MGLQKVYRYANSTLQKGQRTRKALPSHTFHLRCPPSFGGGGCWDRGHRRSPPPDRRLQRPPRPAARRAQVISQPHKRIPERRLTAREVHLASRPCAGWGKGVAVRGRDPHSTDLARAPPASPSGCPCSADSDGRGLAGPGPSGCRAVPQRAPAPASEAVVDAGPLQSKKEPGAFQFPAAREPLLAPAGEPRPLICIHHALWVPHYPPGATPPTLSASRLINPAHHPSSSPCSLSGETRPLGSSVSAWRGPPLSSASCGPPTSIPCCLSGEARPLICIPLQVSKAPPGPLSDDRLQASLYPPTRRAAAGQGRLEKPHRGRLKPRAMDKVRSCT